MYVFKEFNERHHRSVSTSIIAYGVVTAGVFWLGYLAAARIRSFLPPQRYSR
jgi:hypothetical protein